ncbi:hypothetical protein, partial [uncultured Gammaproteobacteria bacterium]
DKDKAFTTCLNEQSSSFFKSFYCFVVGLFIFCFARKQSKRGDPL